MLFSIGIIRLVIEVVHTIFRVARNEDHDIPQQNDFAGKLRRAWSWDADKLRYSRPLLRPLFTVPIVFLFWLAFAPDGLPFLHALCWFLLPLAALLFLPFSGLVLDHKRRRVTQWWGVAIPLRRRKTPLTDETYVIIDSEERAYEEKVWKVCSLYIVVDRRIRVDIEESCSQASACRLGEEAAEHLRLPLTDKTTFPVVTRTPEELDAPLRERVANGRITLTCPEDPFMPLSRQHVGEETLAYDIPSLIHAKSLRSAVCGALLVVLVIAIYAFVQNALDQWYLWAAAGVLMAASLAVGMAKPVRGWFVEASPATLSVQTRYAFWTRTVCVQADRVKYLEVVSAESLEGQMNASTLLRDRYALFVSYQGGNVSLGLGVPLQELEWIKASIEVALNAD